MLKTKYLDMYEGVHAGMVYSNRFDENSDLSTTYLGRTNMTRENQSEIRGFNSQFLDKGLLWENC